MGWSSLQEMKHYKCALLPPTGRDGTWHHRHFTQIFPLKTHQLSKSFWCLLVAAVFIAALILKKWTEQTALGWFLIFPVVQFVLRTVLKQVSLLNEALKAAANEYFHYHLKVCAKRDHSDFPLGSTFITMAEIMFPNTRKALITCQCQKTNTYTHTHSKQQVLLVSSLLPGASTFSQNTLRPIRRRRQVDLQFTAPSNQSHQCHHKLFPVGQWEGDHMTTSSSSPTPNWDSRKLQLPSNKRQFKKIKASWKKRGEKTRQPIRTELSACHSVNSVYKQTEGTHTHCIHTPWRWRWLIMMIMIIKNNRICFSPQ